MKTIEGGVCAAKGFSAAGIHAGVKASSSPDKNDLMLIYSQVPCHAWGMYTQNVVKAASVLVTMEHLKDGAAQAVVANSGNANACCEHGKCPPHGGVCSPGAACETGGCGGGFHRCDWADH